MTLARHARTQLVIVAEAALEKALVRDARARGVRGWTITDVRGAAGAEGERAGDWEADRTIELKLICDGNTAEALAEHVIATYAPNYAVALHFAAVEVVRANRY